MPTTCHFFFISLIWTLPLSQLSEGVSLIDPDVLGDLERRAKVIAGNLNHVMDNLRNSLHAVSQSIERMVEMYIFVKRMFL